MRVFCIPILKFFIIGGLGLYINIAQSQSQSLRPAQKAECLNAPVPRVVYPPAARVNRQEGRVELIVELERLVPGEEPARITKIEDLASDVYPSLVQAAIAGAGKLGGCRIPLSDPDRTTFKTSMVFKLDDSPANTDCTSADLDSLRSPVQAPGPVSWLTIDYKLVAKADDAALAVVRDVRVLGRGGDDPRAEEYLKRLAQLQFPIACAAKDRVRGGYVVFSKRSTSGFGGFAEGSYGLEVLNAESRKALLTISGLGKDSCPIKGTVMIRQNLFNEVLSTTNGQDSRIVTWLKSVEIDPAVNLLGGKLQFDIACQVDNGYVKPIFNSRTF